MLETMERFREASAEPPRSPREASAKPPRSHRGPTSMLRPFEAQPRPLVLKLNASLAAFHRPLSHGLNLIQQQGGANVRDVCGTHIREALGLVRFEFPYMVFKVRKQWAFIKRGQVHISLCLLVVVSLWYSCPFNWFPLVSFWSHLQQIHNGTSGHAP